MDHKPAEAFHDRFVKFNRAFELEDKLGPGGVLANSGKHLPEQGHAPNYPFSWQSLGQIFHSSYYRNHMFVILLLDAPDTDENRTRDETAESICSKDNVKDIRRPGPSTPVDNRKVNWVDSKGQELVSPNSPIDETRSGEVNMEASISQDDIIRAGGFGARDDISSFLPVASDSTDFEATILDARKYEEPQGEIHRPGLGWTEATERK